jgi:preprotein translocase subunit SecF
MFSFVKNRYTFYTIALTLLVLSLLSPFLTRLNMGIDMTGGMQIEYSVAGTDVDAVIATTRTKTIDAVRATLSPDAQKIITDTLVYRVSGTDKFIVEAGVNEDGSALPVIEKAKTAFVTGLTESLAKTEGATISQTRYINIGASFGTYIKSSGFKTLIAAIIAISLYIMYAFSGSIAGMASWPFAVVTGVSLVSMFSHLYSSQSSRSIPSSSRRCSPSSATRSTTRSSSWIVSAPTSQKHEPRRCLSGLSSTSLSTIRCADLCSPL